MDASSGSGRRFVKTTEEDRDAILKNVVPGNTARNTKYAVKLFKSWLADNYQDDDFEQLTDENLNQLLTIFYAEVRSEKGERLSPSTMNTIRCGIIRHLEAPPFKRNISLHNNPLYASSNKMFFSVIKKIKEEGGDMTKHYPSIEDKDLQRILSHDAFDLENPKDLMLKVFFDIQYNFARRGRENLRELKPSYFAFKSDDSGREYAELKVNESTKNHQTHDEHTQKQRMYATYQVNCPVKTLKLYLSKLNKDANSFYCKIVNKKDFSKSDDIWYTTAPVGRNTLGNFMKVISKKLNLSHDYTNHSIRATVVTLLSKHGFQSREIMRLTGHKSEASLRSYEKENSNERKRDISQTLNKFSNFHSEPKQAKCQFANEEEGPSASTTCTSSTKELLVLPISGSTSTSTSTSKSSKSKNDEETYLLDSDSDEMLLIQAVDDANVNLILKSETETEANTTAGTAVSKDQFNKQELKNMAMSCLNRQFQVSRMENCTFNFHINMTNK